MAMEKPPIQGAEAGCKPLSTNHVCSDKHIYIQGSFTAVNWSITSHCSKRRGNKICWCEKDNIQIHERRQYMMPKLEIVKPTFHCKPGASANQHTCFSPSISKNSSQLPSLITPSTIFSRLSILGEEKKEESATPEVNREEEEKAIKERRFYLHPSPRSKPGYTEPELLTLFPPASAKTSKEA